MSMTAARTLSEPSQPAWGTLERRMCENFRRLKSLLRLRFGLRANCFNKCKWLEWARETLDSVPCRFLLLNLLRRTNGVSDYDEQSKSRCDWCWSGFPDWKRPENVLDKSGERQEWDQTNNSVRSLYL